MAGEHFELARSASVPFLRAFFQRSAEEYRIRAVLRVLEREFVSTGSAGGDP
jgi:hypothetical protein